MNTEERKSRAAERSRRNRLKAKTEMERLRALERYFITLDPTIIAEFGKTYLGVVPEITPRQGKTKGAERVRRNRLQVKNELARLRALERYLIRLYPTNVADFVENPPLD
jgi:hypothetical protein